MTRLNEGFWLDLYHFCCGVCGGLALAHFVFWSRIPGDKVLTLLVMLPLFAIGIYGRVRKYKGSKPSMPEAVFVYVSSVFALVMLARLVVL